ncbi:hypothetical protein MATL_G00220960 [Megalops atlanticus]|uniref:Lysozyme g n=1 Tax=Megalops atlanticus TaxID=7932 RepID=A0A9D3SYI9_MEGAT|nr:hypothetical protein MATL_G00220960 [Megalops atlanticus]
MLRGFASLSFGRQHPNARYNPQENAGVYATVRCAIFVMICALVSVSDIRSFSLSATRFIAAKSHVISQARNTKLNSWSHFATGIGVSKSKPRPAPRDRGAKSKEPNRYISPFCEELNVIHSELPKLQHELPAVRFFADVRFQIRTRQHLESADMGRYGDVMRVDTTGASAETSRQDNLPVQGVAASHRMAQHDLPLMNKYKHVIERVGRSQGVDPAVIAGIISRESRAGAALQNGWGDYGNAFGLMQIDKRWHSPQGRWDSEEHVTQATGILTGFIDEMKSKFPSWTPEQCLKGGLAAYNMGPSSVTSYQQVDARTTGRDYSNDVVARAQFYKRQGY